MGQSLRVRLLGAFEVEGVDRQRLGSRKARTLLKLLALARGAPVSVDRIADALWEDEPPARPADQVAVLVSRLRGVLGVDRLPRVEGGYALRADWVDLDAVEELLAEGRRRLATGSVASARAAAEGALTMLRGPLLADEANADWVAVDRPAAERLRAGVHHLAAETALAAGDAAAAAAVAERALDQDRYDEIALRQALAALSAAGRRTAALALYERVREQIADGLGVDPDAASVAAHLAVLQGRPVPGIAVGAVLDAVGPDRPTPETGLHGRDTELARLDAILDQVRGGRFQLVAVEGEAGIGKTRLLEAWAARARASGSVVLSGWGDELGRTLSLQPVLDALSRHLRTLDADAADRLLEPDGALLGPFLDRPKAGFEVPGRGPSVAIDAGSHQTLLFGALAGLLERIAGAGSTVLLLDDAHLSGEATFAWLSFLLRRPPREAVLVVVARRPEEGPRLRAPLVLELGPLDRAAIGAMVGSADAAAVEERTGGNPLLVVELARAGPDLPLPRSLLEAVSARCDRAGPAAATLRTAGVLGPVVDLELLAGVLGAPPATLLDHLEEGVRRQFLSAGDATFAFRHALVREALVAGSSAPRRALIHREAARILGARPEADPLAVAYHARAGGDEALEAEASLAAAQVANRRFDYAEAERLLDRAIALRPVPQALLDRALVRIATRRYREAGDDATAAMARGAGAAALEVAGSAAYFARDFPTARGLAEQGLRLADDSSTRAALFLLAGRERLAEGDLAAAAAFMTEATSVEGADGQDAPYAWVGFLRLHQGRPDEALRVTALPSAASTHGAYLFGTPMVHFTRALALGSLGRPAAAFADLDRLDETIERVQATRFEGRSQNSRGWLLRNLGALGEADEWNQRGLEAARGIEGAEAEAQALVDLAEGRLWAGDTITARRLLVDAEGVRRRPHPLAWRHGLRARLLGARLDLHEERAAEAAAGAMEVVEDAERIGAPKYGVLGMLATARARARLGEPVDREGVDAALRGLGGCAGLEAWWVTAELAAALDVDSWWALSDERVVTLAAAAGERAGAFRAHAARHLDRLRSAGRP